MATNQVQDDDPTIGRLVPDASRDISTLVSKEIQLAKSELKVSVKAGGTGIGLFAGAAFLAVLAIIMLSFAIVYFINWNGDGLALHWAFLIVFGFYLLLAALLVYIGITKVKQVARPEQAIEQGREIPKALKGQSSSLTPVASAGAAAGRDLGRAGPAGVGRRRDLVGGERVAGVVVGDRGREHHARRRRRPRSRSGRRSCPGGSGRAARRPRGSPRRRRRCPASAAAARPGSGRLRRRRARPAGSRGSRRRPRPRTSRVEGERRRSSPLSKASTATSRSGL